MATYNELVIVTDWELVEADDFYLSDKWIKEIGKETMEEARKLQVDGVLYIGYVVPAVHYAIYQQMDARQILINGAGDEIMCCESAVISNAHKDRLAVD